MTSNDLSLRYFLLSALCGLPSKILGATDAARTVHAIAGPYGLAFIWPALNFAAAVTSPRPPAYERQPTDALDALDVLLVAADPIDAHATPSLKVSLRVSSDLREHQPVRPAVDLDGQLWLLPRGDARIGLLLTPAGLRVRLATPFNEANLDAALAAGDMFARELMAID